MIFPGHKWYKVMVGSGVDLSCMEVLALVCSQLNGFMFSKMCSAQNYL